MVVSTAINLEEQTGSTKDLIEEENETKYGLWVNIKEFFRRSKDKIHDIYPINKHELSKEKATVDHRAENAILKTLEKYREIDLISTQKQTLLAELKQEIETLLNKNLNINYQDQFKDNSLLEACKFSSEIALELFVFLRERDAVITPNSYGHTVLHYAAAYNNLDLCAYILECQPDLLEEKSYEEKQTALHYAAKRGRNQVVVALIRDFKANKEAKDSMGRTPLYLAAEHGQSIVVRTLLDFKCDEKITNAEGQKCLFWLVAKCPDIAIDILDTYREVNKYARKDIYYIKHVDLAPIPDEQAVPDCKTILELIVETRNLKLIIHPVIVRLVKAKWRKLAWLWAYADLVFTLLNIVVWNILGVMIPYQDRHIYNFPKDIWRIVLFVLGVIGMIGLTFVELKQVFDQSKYFERVRKQRLREIENDRRTCHPKDDAQRRFLDEEQKMIRNGQIIRSYFSDFWNWYDIISIVLLLACIFTHIADIVSHTDALALNHVRIMSITVIFISLRLLKVGRIINEEFGMLVMTLYFCIEDIVVWLVAYITFWIPFTSAFFMIFGYSGLCEDGSSVDIATENCTGLTRLSAYNDVMFTLYAATFGIDLYDRDQMVKTDETMTYILLGSYIGITTLVMVNIIIALLTTTFNSVHESSKAHFVLQRATEVIHIENNLSIKRRINHLYEIQENYKDSSSHNPLKVGAPDDQESDPVKDSLKETQENIKELYSSLDELQKEMKENVAKLEPIVETEPVALSSARSKSLANEESLKKLQKEFDDLKKTFLSYVEEQEMSTALQSRSPRVDVTNISEFHFSLISPIRIT